MPQFTLLKLPEDLKNVSEFRFTQSQIETNKLWNIKGTPYYIHTAKDFAHSIIHHRIRKKDLIDFQIIRLSLEEMKEIFIHFVRKGEITLVNFPSEDDYYTEIQEQLSHILTQKVRLNKHTPNDIEEAIQEYKYIVEEELLEPHSFRITRNTPCGQIDFTLYSTFSLTADRRIIFISTNKKGANGETDIDQLLENEALSIFQEICEVLGYTTNATCLPIPLLEQKTMLHPLSKADDVIKALFALASDELRNQLNVSKEEWNLIETAIRKYTSSMKNKIIYEEEYHRILKELQNESSA
jgi:hypothetical protein